MTLFTRATELQVLLEAANAADASDELLSRGRVIRDDLLEAAEHLENVRAYRSVIGREDVQPLEAKVIRQAVGGFRGALSRSGPKALQQQAAATLLKVLVEQTKRTDRWVIASWQENFVPAQGLLSRTEAGGLHGSPAHRAMATSRASIISAARSTTTAGSDRGDGCRAGCNDAGGSGCSRAGRNRWGAAAQPNHPRTADVPPVRGSAR